MIICQFSQKMTFDKYFSLEISNMWMDVFAIQKKTNWEKNL